MVSAKVTSMFSVMVVITAGVLYKSLGSGDSQSAAAIAGMTSAWNDAAKAYCGNNDYDGQSSCAICAGVNDGSITFNSEQTFECENGDSATLSMFESLGQYWMGGVTALMREKCKGADEEGSGVKDGDCPYYSYANFAFAVVQNAVDNGDGGAVSVGATLADVCRAIAEAPLPVTAIASEACAASVDGNGELEFSCEDGNSDFMVPNDVLASGLTLDEFVTGKCGGGHARRLTGGRRLFPKGELPVVASELQQDMHDFVDVLEDGAEEVEEDAEQLRAGRKLWGRRRRRRRRRRVGGAVATNCRNHPTHACDNDCMGRCGNGCSCWSWVCGDCNAWKGCAQHDHICSCEGRGMTSDWRCAAVGSYDSSWPGSGSQLCNAVTARCAHPGHN